MNVEQLYQILVKNPNQTLRWQLPDGLQVPCHYHVTEVGKVSKRFLDCGGTERTVETCVLQLWVANDTDHRLQTQKLSKIIESAQFISGDLPVEVEHESPLLTVVKENKCTTLATYPVVDVVVDDGLIVKLGTKHANCLAPEKCGLNVLSCGSSGCC
jgi:hypothetical protein